MEQNEIEITKPISVGFLILELSGLLMYEIYYHVFQTYFSPKNIQLHYADTDSFLLCVNTQDKTNVLENFEDLFDFSILNKEQSTFGNEKNLRASINFKLLRTFG